MPKKPQEKSKSTADYIRLVMEKAEGPLHTDEIVRRMQLAGWKWNSSNPKHVVYTTIHGLIARQGDLADYRALGKGVFATAEKVEEQALEVAAVKVATKAPKKQGRITNEAKVRIPAEKRRCGNCMNLQYTGIQELHRSRGLCAVDDDSGRYCPRSAEAACPFWQPKTQHQQMLEDRRAKELRMVVLTLNLQVARTRR
jgi:hypothetical protein